jgi:hypothetical protein
MPLSPSAVDYQSPNWSGYGAIGGMFTDVTGDWTVPTATCGSEETSDSSAWIGIDGFAGSTVEQDGTSSSCANGYPDYNAWYEMYGNPDGTAFYQTNINQMVVPGDQMSAAVSVNPGGLWTLQIADSTQHWTYSIQISEPTALEASAEWVGERPSDTFGDYYSLSNFGTVTFSDATANDGSGPQSIIALNGQSVEMVGDAGDELAMPSALDSTGEIFTDFWESST